MYARVLVWPPSRPLAPAILFKLQPVHVNHPPGLLLPKRTEFHFGPNHPFGGKVGLCQVRGKYWVALS